MCGVEVIVALPGKMFWESFYVPNVSLWSRLRSGNGTIWRLRPFEKINKMKRGQIFKKGSFIWRPAYHMAI